MSGSGIYNRKPFDGIVCIGGEDWWYHNRGHFDFQIMRRLAAQCPVLFVNSLGVRMPSLGDKSLFAERIWRKLKSLSRGVVRAESNFWVYSPLSVPGPMGRILSGWALAPQIRRAAARAGIRRPVVWMHCPAGASLLGSLNAVATIFQRTDRFEAFPEGNPEELSAQVTALQRAADLTVYAASHLMDEERRLARRQLLVTHGVDFDAFAEAGRRKGGEPLDVRGIARPRAGFIGGIDHHTFDPELFLGVARRLPNVQFVMIGSCSLSEGWCRLSNVTFLGRKPYEMVRHYMAAMDVLIMPWNKSEWIKACNPIKLKEYLAVGRPVVTTDFPALEGWRDLVSVAATADDFAAAIEKAMTVPMFDAEKLRNRVSAEDWDRKAKCVAEAILDLGLVFEPARGSAGASQLIEAAIDQKQRS
jgi:glycosyltransferase involved in cell wall biosynthesis